MLAAVKEWIMVRRGLYLLQGWIVGVLLILGVFPAPAREPVTNEPVAGMRMGAGLPVQQEGRLPVGWEGGQDSGSMGRPRGPAVEGRVGYRWDLPVDLTDKDNVSAQHGGGGVTIRLPVSKTLMGSLDMDVDYVSYSFAVDEDTLFDAAGLMRHAADVRISPMLAGRINKRWSWMARVSGAFIGETDADAWKSFSPGGMAGAVYDIDPNLKLTFGFVASALLADVPLAFPIIGLDWKLNDQLRIATRGPGLDVIMKLTPETTLTVKGRWDYRRYQLAGKGPVPDGIFRDQRVNTSVELSRRFHRILELTLEAGTSVYQQYKLENSDEDTLETIQTDPQAFLGARLTINL